ncbi:MAG: hypothetical protein AB7V36_11925 [Bacteroidales bacterium]
MKTKNWFRFILLMVLLSAIYQTKAQVQPMEIVAVPSDDLPKTYSCGNSSAAFVDKYHDFYNEDLFIWMPQSDQAIRYIKLNIIIVQHSDGTGNFSSNGINPIDNSYTDEQFLTELIDKSNDVMAGLSDPSDNGGSSICGTCNSIKDTRIRYMLTGIRYFQSDTYYGGMNIPSSWMKADEINIIITGCAFNFSVANMPSLTNQNVIHYVYANRIYQDYSTYGPLAALGAYHFILHETGHNFNLCHTYYGGGCPSTCLEMYNKGFYFDDIFGTYPSNNCPERNFAWNSDPYLAADDFISNNIMSGTVTRNYYSPKQVAAIHRNLSLYSIRKCVLVDTYDNSYPIYVDYDEVWDFSFKIYSDVIIKAGKSLTITCNVMMPKNSKIIVEPGAKLIVDGGTLTNTCGGLWQGIELQGNSSLSQLTPGAQGQVILKNGAVIENAIDGITTIANVEDMSSWDWSKTGGIIKAENSTFRNCRRGIQFLSYSNVHPRFGTSLPNMSYIKNCTFETTAALPGDIAPYAFISMYEVNDVKIMGNTFQNIFPSANVFELGNGIISIDSKYSVTPICNSGTFPCTSFDKNEFINLGYGIRASATNDMRPITVKNAVFNECHFGIYASTIDYSSIVDNEFIISEWTNGSTKIMMYGYGLYLDQCKHFKTEGNYFHSSTTSRGWTGMYVNNTNIGDLSVTNEVYRNKFENLYSGMVALNNNGGPHQPDGVTFHCDTFYSNTYDIAVLPQPENPSISVLQGTNNPFSPDPKLFVRNWYSADCSPNDENQFKIDYIDEAGNYIFHKTYNQTEYLPQCHDMHVDVQGIGGFTPQTGDCPCKDGYTPSEIKDNLVQVAIKKNEINSLVDGGQTNYLVGIALSNIPSGQILQTMLEFSPYLSDEVLLTLIERPNALSPGTMQQILAANSPLSDEVYQAVQAMQTPLPKGIRNQIAALQTGEMSDRDQLPYGIAYYEYTEKVLESDLVRYYLNDTLTVNPMDSVMKILEQTTTKNSKLNLVSAYISSRHFAKANQTLDSLVNIDADLVSYSEKQRLNILTMDLPGKELSLLSDSSKMQVLQSIANDTLQYGAVYAKNTLELLNDTLFAELTLIPMPETDNRSMITYSSGNQPEIEKGLITCYPNPAGEKFTAHYEVESACTEMFLVIHNVMGKEVSRIRVNECIGDVELSSPAESGTYYVYIESCGQYIAIDKIVVTR